MERKSSTLIIMLVLVPLLLSASWKTRIYRAYISNDMNAWKTVMDEMESQKTNDNTYLAELVNYQYGYIGYCLGIDDDEAAEKYLDRAETNIGQLEKHGYSGAVTKAYQSAFYGYRIGLSPMKAPFLGPKSINHAELAMQEDKNEPLGYIQLGNAQFYMPAIFGGSKKKAIDYFKKAETLMEAKPEIWIKENWNYLSLLALIGQSYEEIKNYEQAENYYKKALEAEPGFQWVINELLPKLEKLKKNE